MSDVLPLKSRFLGGTFLAHTNCTMQDLLGGGDLSLIMLDPEDKDHHFAESHLTAMLDELTA